MNSLPHSLFIGDTEMKVKSDVKIEVIESDPLHLYFSTSNGLGSGKMETGEIHLTLDQLSGKYRQVWIEAPEDSINSQAPTQADKAKITNSRRNYQQFYRKEVDKWICLSCEAKYDSTHGIHYHLNHTTCGFGDKQKMAPKKDFRCFYTRENEKFVCVNCSQRYDTIRGVHYHLNNKKCGQIPPRNLLPVQLDTPQSSEMKAKRSQPGPKRNYLKFYRKENNQCVCLSCGTRYQSVHGMHNHLNLTKCGFGEKFKSSPKTNYTQFYRKEDEKLICNSCGIHYSSMHGMHYHLNSTKCGYGAKDKVTPKRNYQEFYTKVENSYICNHCQYKIDYLQGIHRHLRNCDGSGLGSDPLHQEKITIISPAPTELEPAVKYKQVTVTAHTGHHADINFIGHDQNL